MSWTAPSSSGENSVAFLAGYNNVFGDDSPVDYQPPLELADSDPTLLDAYQAGRFVRAFVDRVEVKHE